MPEIDLDPVLHSPARITIMVRLVRGQRWTFARLRQSTGLTDGNLASHLRALEQAGYARAFDGLVRFRVARVIEATRLGIRRYRAYVRVLEALLMDLQDADNDGTLDESRTVKGPR